MTTEQMTTIKVPVELRDRLRERAEAEHVTQAQALETLLNQARHPGIEKMIDQHMDRWKPLLDRLA
jgi:putative heme iron utilization protein